jgi:hypothetical protein
MFIWNSVNNEYIEDVESGYVPRFIRHYAKGWACCGHSGHYSTAVDCLNAVTLQDTQDQFTSQDY